MSGFELVLAFLAGLVMGGALDLRIDIRQRLHRRWIRHLPRAGEDAEDSLAGRPR